MDFLYTSEISGLLGFSVLNCISVSAEVLESETSNQSLASESHLQKCTGIGGGLSGFAFPETGFSG